MPVDELKRQLEIIKRGVAEIVPEEELVEKLKKSLNEGKPLRVKLGLDPTAPDIHLGHTVVLQKLKQFQSLGHEVIIIIGDFTAQIGDPTGKKETRKQLSWEEVLENAKTYQEQIFKILDPAKTKMVFNSEWLAKLTFADVIKLASKYTVARMLEREDFAKRFKEGQPISIHEFFYPLMQGYDSVALKADIELGGTDQKFNLLMGRTLQKEYGQEPQIAIMMPILEGTDGVQKMSKSLGNYIGINETPQEMFGKIMSIPDTLILRYLELLTSVPMETINEMKIQMETGVLNPRDAKVFLAKEIITQYHSREAADEAEREFIKIFREKELPDEIPEYKVPGELIDGGVVLLPKVLFSAGTVKSISEAKRLISQGAVLVNQEKINDINFVLKPSKEPYTVKVGKRRFLKISFEE
ncbi:tyrosine--tRNA ligase [Carboxydothermus ferrireducens]|uniref:tyrosine--tRNA ligase n=1 Tax=Carboxydothermus ferrireducens TaxID=54265 RepID=UPI0015CAF079|nr:tyrosine--tRNA ligase [Carboxydothermus ferrireducens]